MFLLTFSLSNQLLWRTPRAVQTRGEFQGLILRPTIKIWPTHSTTLPWTIPQTSLHSTAIQWNISLTISRITRQLRAVLNFQLPWSALLSSSSAMSYLVSNNGLLVACYISLIRYISAEFLLLPVEVVSVLLRVYLRCSWYSTRTRLQHMYGVGRSVSLPLDVGLIFIRSQFTHWSLQIT